MQDDRILLLCMFGLVIGAIICGAAAMLWLII